MRADDIDSLIGHTRIPQHASGQYAVIDRIVLCFVKINVMDQPKDSPLFLILAEVPGEPTHDFFRRSAMHA